MTIRLVQPVRNVRDELLSLDWTSLGCLVRQAALEAVTCRFAELAAASPEKVEFREPADTRGHDRP